MSPIIPREWAGGPDGDEWTLEVETDRFEEDGPTVVSIEAEDVSGSGLAVLSPEEAREVADALHVYAFLAEKEDQRRERVRKGKSDG